jgi:predicted ester cyclase
LACQQRNGRKAKWTLIIIGRFERDKLAEDWAEYDRYNMFRQLGAL